jgi:hypothetical protein
MAVIVAGVASVDETASNFRLLSMQKNGAFFQATTLVGLFWALLYFVLPSKPCGKLSKSLCV